MEQSWGYFLCEFLKELSGDVIAPQSFVLWHRHDGILDLFESELFDQLDVHLNRDPGRGAGPPFLPGFSGAEGVCFRSIKVHIE